MKFKRHIIMALALALITTALGGCATRSNNSNGAGDFSFSSYPIEGDNKLTYLMFPAEAVTSQFENFGQTEIAKELEKNTGVSVEYLHPAAGQGDQILSLMIASNDLPDIVEHNWSVYQGGAAKSIADGVIIELNDLIDEHAPNLKKFLEENPEIDKMIKTDDGKYYAFPFIRNDKLLLKSAGLMIRKDWLKKWNLEMPKTISDVEDTLRAFKENGVAIPLSCRQSDTEGLLNLFGTSRGFYVDDGKVVYGPSTEAYKTALETLKRWYKEGLLDGNFLVNDKAALDSNVLTGKCGMCIGSGGGDLGSWLDATTDPNFEMVGMPNVTQADGSIGYVSMALPYPGDKSAAITTACENPELAVRYLDYAYSEEGTNLLNYGIEGVSYTVENGVHKYTDEIYNNPDGLTTAEAMVKYFRSSTSGPFIQQKDYILGFYYRDLQQESLNAWLECYDEVVDMQMPAIAFTDSEADENANIMNEVDTYVSKSRSDFILGTRDLSEFDDYISELKGLGINKAIQIREDAIKRYNKR